MDIRELVLSSPRLTPFQRKVYLALLEVPRGQTLSYKQLAQRIGCRSAQAVGQALRRNPFAVGLSLPPSLQTDSCSVFTLDFCVPCHRIVSADGTLGGFFGQRDGEQLLRKRELLLQEGTLPVPSP